MISDDEKYGKLISTLIVLTKEDRITWNYLDAEKSIYSPLGIAPPRDKGTFTIVLGGPAEKFDTSNSFYTCINKNYIVIYVLNSNDEEESFTSRLKLLLVPRTFKSVVEVKNPSEIVRLQTLIKSKFPSPDDIISDVLNIENQ